MPCAPCKVALLKAVKTLEELPEQAEPLRSELRRTKELLTLAGYYVSQCERKSCKI